MKAQPWLERRKEYLAGKEHHPAKVINIADGFIKVLAGQLREKKEGYRDNQQLEASGAAISSAAPEKIEGGAAS